MLQSYTQGTNSNYFTMKTIKTLISFIAAVSFCHDKIVASARKPTNQSRILQPIVPHVRSLHIHRFNQINRGGDAKIPNSSTYWSTPRKSTNPFQRGSNSTPSQRQNYHQWQQQNNNEITVTDVTDELKAQNKQESKEAMSAILTRDNRNTFIARVYTILSAQLLITALSSLLFAKHPNMTYWILSKGKIVPLLCGGISTFAVMAMSISEKARQSSPMKWYLLTIFTLGEALLVGMLSSLFKSKTVISAFLSTALATVSVTGYTLMNKNAKYDLSQWGAGLSS